MPDLPLYRSRTVADLVGMPVGTLRVWERRYGLGSAARSPAGHRLYDDDDVRRIGLIKTLTDRGHAIGTLAGVDVTALQALAAARGPGPAAALRAPLRLVVVGEALAVRLRALADRLPAGRLLPAWRVLAVFDGAEEAARGAAARADAVLAGASFLPSQPSSALQQAARAWGGARVGVVFGFASRAAYAAHEVAGVALLRESCDEQTLRSWVERLAPPGSDASSEACEPPRRSEAPPRAPHAAPPRRFDDLTLSALAARTPALACECPRHVADLLLQLSHFEAYSAQCAHRDDTDAQLHAHLHQVAGMARALLEDALQRLADHEGVALPAAAAP